MKNKIKRSILLLSPYNEDYGQFVSVSEGKYSYIIFSNAQALYKFISQNNLNYIILISSKTDDDYYCDIVKYILSKSDDHRIIVYSKWSSINEVSSTIQLGVYHYAVGDNCYFDVVSCLDKFFDSDSEIDIELPVNINQPLLGYDALEIIENSDLYFSGTNLELLLVKFSKWKKTLGFNNEHSILIVEDEIMYLNFLTDLISTKFIVHGVSLGEHAVEKVKSNFYSVILVDLFLPDKDGVKLVEELRELSPLSEIIVNTAFDLPDSASDIFKLGIHSYLNKPILKDKLFDVIYGALCIVQKKAMNHEIITKFFSHVLSVDEKIVFIKALASLKTGNGQQLLIEDVSIFFPELKTKNFPFQMVFPLFDSDDRFEAYIKALVKI
jgi:ActR/RegA family two-component response regulator